MAFSAVDAAVSGVRLTARKPAAVAVWSLAVMLVGIASMAQMAAIAGPQLAKLSTEDGTAAGVDWAAFAGGYGLTLLTGFAAAAVLYPAVYRAVLKPEDDRFAYIRLGADELRMAGLFAILVAIFGAISVAVGIMLSLVLGVVMVGTGASGNPMALSLAPILAVALMLVPFSWLGVRLSLAGPMTLDTGRISIGSAWSLTRGRFWPLFGAYALGWVLLAVVWMASTALALLVAAAIGGAGGMAEAWGARSSFTATSLEAVFSPTRLASLVAASLLGGVYYAVWLAPAAAAYRALRPETDVSETFA